MHCHCLQFKLFVVENYLKTYCHLFPDLAIGGRGRRRLRHAVPPDHRNDHPHSTANSRVCQRPTWFLKDLTTRPDHIIKGTFTVVVTSFNIMPRYSFIPHSHTN